MNVKRFILALVSVAALCAPLSACGPDEAVAAPALRVSPNQTDAVFQALWKQETEPHKNKMCWGLHVMGHQWMVDHFKKSKDAVPGMDYDQVTDLMSSKCNTERRYG
jgi:hypothetical protein